LATTISATIAAMPKEKLGAARTDQPEILRWVLALAADEQHQQQDLGGRRGGDHQRNRRAVPAEVRQLPDAAVVIGRHHH
jgi:hypothetical protein